MGQTRQRVADFERRLLVGRRVFCGAAIGMLSGAGPQSAIAGMGVPVPTELRVAELPQIRSLSPWIDARLQTLSFFFVSVLLCALAVKGLWGLVRRDWPGLPSLSYRGALAATLLWGLVSVVVLTMISGARELMTPGAWKQHGWTYRLTDEHPKPKDTPTKDEADARSRQRRQGIEQLKTHLWGYARQHDGRFPDRPDLSESVWQIPTMTGATYTLIPKQSQRPESATVLPLAYESTVPDWSPHYVLLTSGVIVLVTEDDLYKILRPGKELYGPLEPFGP